MEKQPANIEAVTIRDYQPGDGPGIVRLLNDVFSEGDENFAPRTLQQWQWVYEQNPAGRQVVVAVAPDGRIVGHYACIPYRVRVRGTEALCGQGVDSMVSAEYRRGLQSEGLFLRTARRYFETYGIPEQNAYGYGFPNKKAFRIGVRLLKYVPVHSPVQTLGCNLFGTRPTGEPDAESGVGSTGEIVPIDRFCGEADRLWQRLAPAIGMGTIRDDRFLNWRYFDCPFADYRCFALRDPSGVRGLYISRANWTGPPILALSEFLVPGDDPGAAVRLLKHAVAEARTTGQQRVEVWLPPAHPLFGVAETRGFVAEDSPFHLCIKIYDAEIDPAWVRQNWYFSIGDTDVF